MLIKPLTTQILFATENGFDVTSVCGGHSCSGASSSEDLVIDLRYLKSVAVNAEKQHITVGGGAVWADVDQEAAKFGLATVGGTVNHTGLSAQHYTYRGRLTWAAAIKVLVALPSAGASGGSQADTDSSSTTWFRLKWSPPPAIFWFAARSRTPIYSGLYAVCSRCYCTLIILTSQLARAGGGPNFGIVTSFVFKAYPQPNDVWAGFVSITAAVSLSEI